ncbi:hypothetical protein [Catellatospora paridis]|uniref:hypothetical protein n=1 Tax=Catellatospora paridis TaxID=1617086 RepID=UPI0012D4224F|nr:hypothetical protein [Catellatospora paridis]
MRTPRATRRGAAALTLTAALGLATVLSGSAGPRNGSPSGVDGQATTGCASPAAAPSPIETAGTTMYGSIGALDQALAEIQHAAEGRFADVFAGVLVVSEKGHAIVYRVRSAEFDAYAESVSGGQCLYLRDADHSQATLLALTMRISGDTAYWREQGIVVHMVGPRHDGSGVTVGVEQVERARVELPKRYGTQIPIEVEESAGRVLL